MTARTKTLGTHWLAARFSKPLDRLWLGGVAAVNALVWAAFGMQYIGLALIAYCFVFVLVLRRRIKADYPAAANKAYRIGFIHNRPRLFSGKLDKAFLHMLWIFPAYCATAVALSVLFGSVGLLSHGLVFLICNGVLLCQYQSLFTVCCSGGRLAVDSAVWKMLLDDESGDAPSTFRPVVTTVLFALAWGGVLAAYTTGQMGESHFFGIAEHGADRLYAAALGLVVPVILHVVLFKLATATLRGWGGLNVSAAKYFDGHAKTVTRCGILSIVLVLLCTNLAYAETPSKESVLRLLATQPKESMREVFYQAIEFAKENSLNYDASMDEMILSEATSDAALSRLHAIRVSIYQKHYTQQDVDEETACNNSPAAIKWNKARPQIKEDVRVAHEKWQVRVARQNLQQYADKFDSNDSNAFGDTQENAPLSATPSPESVRRFLSATEYSKEFIKRKMERAKRRFLSNLHERYPDAPIGQISDMHDNIVNDEALEQLSDAHVAIFQKHFEQQDIDKLLECYGTPRAKIRYSRVLSETFRATRDWTIDLLDRVVQKRETQTENSK